jgi:hypothetical protein
MNTAFTRHSFLLADTFRIVIPNQLMTTTDSNGPLEGGPERRVRHFLS